MVAISITTVEYRSWLDQKLVHLCESSKTKLSILKRFQNGKKVPVIPTVLINNRLESEFKTNANYCDSFFASKCTSLVNDSTVLNSPQYVSIARYVSFASMKELYWKLLMLYALTKTWTWWCISLDNQAMQ